MTPADAAEPTYTFGDSETAGDRLALLASVFGPASEALLRSQAPARPDLAVDLGCGPGSTTRLLASTTRAARTIGLERSPAFVDRARRDAPPGIEFLCHDVTRTPLPTGPADVIFARYLLAHLPQPVEVASRWAAHLATDGRLVLEEVEDIDTTVTVFSRYLDVAVAMIAGHGADMYAGRILRDSMPASTKRVASRTATSEPPTATVARLFAMNLATWRHDVWVEHNVERAEIATLERGLHELLDSASTGEIVWTHRQVVYERL